MQGSSPANETRKSNGSFGSTPEQVFTNSTPNNIATLVGSVNSSTEEKKVVNENPNNAVGIEPASPAQTTTKAQYAKNLFFGSPLRTGLTAAAFALLAVVSKTGADCANGDCVKTAEEMQRLFMANATTTAAAKAATTAGVDLVSSVTTGVIAAAAHAGFSKVRGFFSRTQEENSAGSTGPVSTRDSGVPGEERPLLPGSNA